MIIIIVIMHRVEKFVLSYLCGSWAFSSLRKSSIPSFCAIWSVCHMISLSHFLYTECVIIADVVGSIIIVVVADVDVVAAYLFPLLVLLMHDLSVYASWIILTSDENLWTSTKEVGSGVS